MEMSTLIFICSLMMDSKTLWISPFTYYLVQSISSMLMIFSILFLIYTPLSQFMIIPFYIMMFSFLMKLAMFPFMAWQIFSIKFTSWMNIFLMTSIQKLIPMMFLLNLNLMKIYFLFSAMLTALTSSLIMFNELNMKKIMNLSSMINSSWMMFLIFNNSISWIIYIIIYFMINFLMFIFLNKFNLNFLIDFNKMNFSMSEMIILSMIILSLMGFPPFPGFFIKFITLNELNLNKEFLCSMFMIFSSFFSMFNYLRMIFYLLFTNQIKFKYNKYSYLKFNLKFNIYMMFILSMIIFPSSMIIWT
uniref:NADH-ubiquinone oxidoreductase chain 2 n=1 Tax=Eustenogaster scitula TaxID=1980568 RepID=A0A510A476_9HYME|nr:NADH dehydrogenase subunit 2 [Eustenogaster scitula]ARO89838.1 NADH dehydrogenase subunit 2 [Eustenogaster scitula]